MENSFSRNIIPDNDPQRIEAVRRYRILYTAPEEEFDQIVKLATAIFKVPVSLISFVDAEHVFFKAGSNNNNKAPRGDSFCAMAILSPEITVIENAPDDPCLLTNPHVAGEFGLRFYAGAPLVTGDNFQLGTICVLDVKPRKFTKEEQDILAGLSKMVMRHVEVRLKAIHQADEHQQLLNEQADTNRQLLASNQELEMRVQQRTGALQLANTKLARILTQLPAPLMVLQGANQVVETANNSLLSLWNKTSGQVIGKPVLDIFPELTGQPVYALWTGVFETGIAIADREKPVMFKQADGSERRYYIDYHFLPLTDVEGNRTGVLATLIDVTDKVTSRNLLEANEAELKILVKDLAAGEKKLDQIIDQLPASITVLTGNDLIVERINASNLNYWQKHRDEVIGFPLLTVLPELVNQPFPGQLRQVMQTGEMIVVTEGEVNLVNPRGEVETTYVDYSYQAITDSDGNRTGVLVMSNDVTETVIARKKLEESEKALQAINKELDQSRTDLLFTIDAAGIGTFDLNPVTGRFTGNDLLKAWFGLAADDEIELSRATSAIAEDDRDRVLKAIQHALEFASGGKYDVEYAISNPNEPAPRIVRAKGKALFNDARQPIRLSGTVQDITEQKRDEQRKNDFIGMVSHELKTPLTSLTAIIQVANSKLQASPDTFLAGAMDKADMQVKRMSKMINSFLNVSRLESGKLQVIKELFDLDQLLKEVISEGELNLSTHIVTTDICDHISVNADRDKIGSVIANLLSNAIKYSPGGTTINIGCKLLTDSVQVSVSDQGIGIEPEDKERLFERYYRVEADKTRHISGFGIGLYLSAEIITRHNGRIWVESEVGEGSTFCFTLPVV